jgi:hypothetical protein
MDLREFVAITLRQIVDGVKDAQTSVASGGEVNPKIWVAQRGDAAKMKILESNSGKWIHMVDFDVAVTVMEATETKGGVGLVVGPVVLGSKGQSNAESATVSRIRFQVPIAFPENAA